MLEAIEKGLNKDQQKVAQDNKPGEDVKKDEKKPEEEMPAGLSSKAQDRFRELATSLREARTELEQLRAEREQLASYATYAQNFDRMIKSIGATDDQLQAAAAYIRAFNSGDLQTRRNILLNELRDVSMQLGEPIESFIEGADPLSQFPDLKNAVDSFQLDRERALELARLRTIEQQRMQAVQSVQMAEQQRQHMVTQWVSEKDQAIAEIDKITKEMAKTDPYYPEIQTLLMSDEKGLANIVQNTPPSTWVSQVKMLISATRAAVARQRAAGGGEPRPLSGGSGKPQGSAKAPTSMYEAIFGGR